MGHPPPQLDPAHRHEDPHPDPQPRPAPRCALPRVQTRRRPGPVRYLQLAHRRRAPVSHQQGTLAPAALPPPLGDRDVTPLTVLQTARKEWQARKKAWAAAGLVGEEGRDHVTVWPTITREEGIRWQRLVSVFDPHLTDLHYHWYCPPGGRILDPFAGGATRGLVAAARGYHYTGIEDRKSTRLNSSHVRISYAVFCLKKKNKKYKH